MCRCIQKLHLRLYMLRVTMRQTILISLFCVIYKWLSEADRNCAAENPELDDNGILHLRAVLGNCLNMVANLTKDCIDGITHPSTGE